MEQSGPSTPTTGSYYAEKGTPPGYWLGTGVHGLGTNDRQIEAGGNVTESHLRLLLGQGCGPVTGDPLGLPYFRHKTVEERIATRVEHLGPPRAFRTAELVLIHAASCRFRYSLCTSCGVRYPSAEWSRVRL